MYVLYIQCIYISVQYAYISLQYIYLFLMQSKCKGLTFIVFGTVHSDRTVVVLLYKHFHSWRSIFSNSVSIMNYTYATMSKSNSLFTFFKPAYYV